MMKDSQFEQLERLPDYWRGRAMLRLMEAEACKSDPVMERFHTSVAREYEQKAQRLGWYAL